MPKLLCLWVLLMKESVQEVESKSRRLVNISLRCGDSHQMRIHCPLPGYPVSGLDSGLSQTGHLYLNMDSSFQKF